MSTQLKTKKGFTIIEVVLVLAIAGLIFMMVFLALPALQRAQKDTQRRDDLARFASQITQYQTNNRGRVPNTAMTKGLWITASDHADDSAAKAVTSAINSTNKGSSANAKNGEWSTFLTNYMWAANDDFTDPGGTPYAVEDHGKITVTTSVADKFSNGAMDFVIHVYHGAVCGVTEGTVEPSTSGSTRKLAFIYKLEGSGFYCGEV